MFHVVDAAHTLFSNQVSSNSKAAIILLIVATISVATRGRMILNLLEQCLSHVKQEGWVSLFVEAVAVSTLR